MPHILVTDSDGASLQQVAALLEKARYHVTRATDGRSVIQLIAKQAPDLILLEALLPDQEGFEVCRRIRRTSDIPIIFFSTQARLEDRVVGLRLGADDYLAKPCAPAELLARISAVLRRTRWAHKPPTEIISAGGWRLDPLRHACIVTSGATIELTPREVHLLALLMQRCGRVCTTNQIIRSVWGYSNQQTRSIVATSIWRLRSKLEAHCQDAGRLITVRNIGYKFEA